MMKKLNSFLRVFFILFGAFYLITELMPEKALQDHKEGFDNEEFDDIW